MEIKIEDHLSADELKAIVEDEVRKHVRQCVGEASVSSDKGTKLMITMAKQLARDGVQELIPNFKELLNEHIQTSIKEIKLSDMFMETFGWRSVGNKILNEVLTANKPLIDAKVKEIFRSVDK